MIVGCGGQSRGDSTAIQARDVSGLWITENTIVEASPTAISVYSNNYNFNVAGNVIVNP